MEDLDTGHVLRHFVVYKLVAPLAEGVHRRLAEGVLHAHDDVICLQLHGHLNEQKAESYTIQAVIDKWSKLEIMNPVTNINAAGNSVTLQNGKEFTYKALIMAPGMNHSMDGIKGLEELADEDD